jgi:riboflavin synthase
MFTGIIEAVGHVVALSERAGAYHLRVGTALAADLALGDSLAVNGVCLTITGKSDAHVDADIGPETAAITTLSRLSSGSAVNLERPLRADTRMGGHFVLGHVDAVGVIDTIWADADSHWIRVAFPAAVAAYLIPKGSIAVDGVSLTVARLADGTFDVQIVPFTWTHTAFQHASAGDAVNLECDMIGKYVVRAVELAHVKGRAL